MSKDTITPHKILITLSVLFLIGYIAFNSRFLLRGPDIAMAGMEDTESKIVTDNKNFSLSGVISHSSFISINNRPIFIDEAGNFTEKLLLSNGASIIDIYARDKFGKEVRKKIDVVYTGEDQSYTLSALDIATSSMSSSTTDTVALNQDVSEDVSVSSSFVSGTSTESE